MENSCTVVCSMYLAGKQCCIVHLGSASVVKLELCLSQACCALCKGCTLLVTLVRSVFFDSFAVQACCELVNECSQGANVQLHVAMQWG